MIIRWCYHVAVSSAGLALAGRDEDCRCRRLLGVGMSVFVVVVVRAAEEGKVKAKRGRRSEQKMVEWRCSCGGPSSLRPCCR